MTLTGTIVFEFDDERPAETVPFLVGASEAGLLRTYLDEAIVLERTIGEWGGIQAKFSMSVAVDRPATVEVSELKPDQRATLLHVLRPFILEKEPFSFKRVRGILARSSDHPFLKHRLNEIKRLYAGEMIERQIQIRLGDIVVDPDRTLLQWLNGFEYHRDADARAEVAKIQKAIPPGLIQVVFLGLLRHKVKAILHAGNIIHRMLGPESPVPALDA